MSQQNVEFVKGFLAAGAGMDKQALLAAYTANPRALREASGTKLWLSRAMLGLGA